MEKETAVQILFARMLGATHRRIAELFGLGPNQKAGEKLLAEAEDVLQLPHGLVDTDKMDSRIHYIASELDWTEGV